MDGSTSNYIQFFMIYASDQLKPVLVDLGRGLNSLNLDNADIRFMLSNMRKPHLYRDHKW